ncbi:type II CAAX prenyl endopeptidase Rce1 family protein [Streptomyces barkulensis]|uniref:CPBP family glutamic-type intramembrane protease n=1 Tax=Streptomyces barkulensis TaxID=1257026 RepID=UPI000C6CCE4D|nr:CPBP family glutamic-type intramembrane protease [Streptomyces barkulensis]
MAHIPPNTTTRGTTRGPARRPARTAGARRAERDLWGLLLVTCAVPLTGSLLDFARLCGAPVDGWSGAVLPWLRLLCSLAAGRWLAGLLAQRRAPRLRGAALAVAAVAGAARVADLVRAGEFQGVVGSVATTALLAWLCGELAARHGTGWRGLGIGPSGARPAAERLTAVMVFGAVFVLAYTTVTWMAALRTGLPAAAPWLPVLDRAQSAALGWSGPADMVANILFTGVAEEMVLVGAVVVLGRAAGRPLWAACALSLLLRVAAHLYLGVPGVALLLLGSCALLLHLRRRRLTPLVAGHIAYDLTASFAPSSEVLHNCVLAVLLGTGTAFAAWLLWFAPAGSHGREAPGKEGGARTAVPPGSGRRAAVASEAGRPDGAVAADGPRT